MGIMRLSTKGIMTIGNSRPLDLCIVMMVIASWSIEASTGYWVPSRMSFSIMEDRSDKVIREPRWASDSMVMTACVKSLSRP